MSIDTTIVRLADRLVLDLIEAVNNSLNRREAELAVCDTLICFSDPDDESLVLQHVERDPRFKRFAEESGRRFGRGMTTFLLTQVVRQSKVRSNDARFGSKHDRRPKARYIAQS